MNRTNTMSRKLLVVMLVMVCWNAARCEQCRCEAHMESLYDETHNIQKGNLDMKVSFYDYTTAYVDRKGYWIVEGIRVLPNSASECCDNKHYHHNPNKSSKDFSNSHTTTTLTGFNNIFNHRAKVIEPLNQQHHEEKDSWFKSRLGDNVDYDYKNIFYNQRQLHHTINQSAPVHSGIPITHTQRQRLLKGSMRMRKYRTKFHPYWSSKGKGMSSHNNKYDANMIGKAGKYSKNLNRYDYYYTNQEQSKKKQNKNGTKKTQGKGSKKHTAKPFIIVEPMSVPSSPIFPCPIHEPIVPHPIEITVNLFPTVLPSINTIPITAVPAPTIFPTFNMIKTIFPTPVKPRRPHAPRPTFLPTTIRSSQILPSWVPSIDPSTTPTNEPSMKPSWVPSIDPSTNPTIEPSMTPSKIPTNIPSTVPSDNPSSIPSTIPSMVPSWIPTFVASSSPTEMVKGISPGNGLPTNFPTITNQIVPDGTYSPSDSLRDSPTLVPTLNTIETLFPTSYTTNRGKKPFVILSTKQPVVSVKCPTPIPIAYGYPVILTAPSRSTEFPSTISTPNPISEPTTIPQYYYSRPSSPMIMSYTNPGTGKGHSKMDKNHHIMRAMKHLHHHESKQEYPIQFPPKNNNNNKEKQNPIPYSYNNTDGGKGSSSSSTTSSTMNRMMNNKMNVFHKKYYGGASSSSTSSTHYSSMIMVKKDKYQNSQQLPSIQKKNSSILGGRGGGMTIMMMAWGWM